SFTEMLAQRQERLADATQSYAALPADTITAEQRASISRRQLKMRELSTLAERAFEGMALREAEVGAILATAFRSAADGFANSGLKSDMTEAAGYLEQAAWLQAVPPQRAAGGKL